MIYWQGLQCDIKAIILHWIPIKVSFSHHGLQTKACKNLLHWMIQWFGHEWRLSSGDLPHDDINTCIDWEKDI